MQEKHSTFKRSIWWRVYFYIFTTLMILGILSTVINGGSTLLDIIEFPIFIAFTIGLYGYVYNKKILWQKFWVFILLVDILETMYYYFISGADLSVGVTPEEYLYTTIVIVVIATPSYIGLFLYSLPSNQLWTKY